MLLLAVAAAILLHPVWRWLLGENTSVWLTDFATFSIIGLLLYLRRPLHTINLCDVARYLNHRFPQLEYSCELPLKASEQLNPLEKLQAEKVLRKLQNLQKRETRPPVAFKNAALLLLCGFGLNALLVQTDLLTQKNEQNPAIERFPISGDKTTHAEQNKQPPLKIISADVRIVPPAYTQLPARKSRLKNINTPEGSQVTWTIVSSRKAQKAWLVFNDKERVAMTAKNETTFEAGKTAWQSGYFGILIEGSESETFASDYFKLNIAKNLAPQVQITQPDESMEVDLVERNSLVVKARAKDDYAIENAYIMATITKGEGESVTFREERLPFGKKRAGGKGELFLESVLHFKNLEVEPGNELYFYVAATDNKEPNANTGRSEMHFVSFRDTAKIASFESSGLGVDLMPTYFRSQRQIINDTEKLLAERPQLSHEKWMQHANVIGEDQKLLRLRYGKFLGEEYESGIWAPENSGHGEHTHKAEAKHEAHEHDEHTHEVEAEHEEETDTERHKHKMKEKTKLKESHAGHDHGHEEGGKPKENTLGMPAFLEQYVHFHDSAEEATYFGNEIKRQLKAAMAQMWEAELHLRLGKPDVALPYEYKALKLIKEIQQKSRIYVHKTGFDIAPLKEAKWRLKGELDDAGQPRVHTKSELPLSYPNCRRALRILNRPDVAEELPKLSTDDLQTLELTGGELSKVTLAQEGNYLPALRQLRILLEEYEQTGNFCRSCAKQVQAAIWQLLPEEEKPIPHNTINSRSLNGTYYRNLYGK